MPTFADYLDTVSSAEKGPNTQGLNPDLSGKLEQAKAAYRQQFGKELPITSGFRTREEQTKLAASPNKYPVATPGTSLHETGNAVDIGKDVPDSFLAQYGLHRPLGKKDPVHVTLMPSKTSNPQGKTFADWIDTLPAEGSKAAPTEQKQEMPAIAQMYNQFQQKKRDLGAGLASLADTTIGGIIPNIAGPVTYAGARALGQSPEQAAVIEQKVVGATDKPFGKSFGITNDAAYQQEASRKIMDFVGQNIGKGAEWIAEKTGLPVGDVQNMMGTSMVAAAPVVGKVTKPVVEMAKPIARTVEQWKSELGPAQLQQQFEAKGGMRSGGAAATTGQAELQAAIAQASPELAAELKTLKPNEANMAAINRQLKGDSLPVPVKYTRGQATQDVSLLSDEMNQRGRNPEYANRFSEQNNALKENFDAIRDKAAPDVFGTNHLENADTIINSYKAVDDARVKDIGAKYKALKDAAGGDFPIDGQAFAHNAYRALSKELKSDFVPPGIDKQLSKFASGEKMTYEQFEAMRTNLAAEMRKAERSGDGNAKAASSIVRQALEDLPLSGDAATLKPLADQARSAAKARFDILKKDPAYDAAVNDIAPDKFINKYVINGNKRDLETLVNQLGGGSEGHQAVSAATINWLKDKSISSGNFNQASYNRALKQIEPKLNQLVDAETAKNLRTLGEVAADVQAQPRGSFVNNSNTFVAGAKALAASGLEKGANTVLGAGIVPVGSMIRESAQKRALKQETAKALRPGAGTKLSDIGK